MRPPTTYGPSPKFHTLVKTASTYLIMATTSRINSKSPTIRRIRKLHPPVSLPNRRPPPNNQTNHSLSPRSARTLNLPLPRLHRHPSRNGPIRMALHAQRAAQLRLRRRNLPRAHRPTPRLPTQTALLPVRHALRPLRDQPRDLPVHQRPPRRDMAAGVGPAHGARRAAQLHGDGRARPARGAGDD